MRDRLRSWQWLALYKGCTSQLSICFMEFLWWCFVSWTIGMLLNNSAIHWTCCSSILHNFVFNTCQKLNIVLACLWSIKLQQQFQALKKPFFECWVWVCRSNTTTLWKQTSKFTCSVWWCLMSPTASAVSFSHFLATPFLRQVNALKITKGYLWCVLCLRIKCENILQLC